MTLHVLCWDHPRCTTPMLHAAPYWQRRFDIDVTWDSRPLSAFNDQPIAEAVAGYDLVFVDHPLIPGARTAGALRAVDQLLPADTLATLAADSIANSHRTYTVDGRQWALAVDATCQVAVCDARRLGRLAEVPRIWDEVLRLARRPGVVGLPMNHTDLLLALMSITRGLSSQDAGQNGEQPADGLISRESVELLVALIPSLHPASIDANPPRLLDRMAHSTDSPIYVPLIFGYAHYQRLDAAGRRLTFLDAPTGDGTAGGTVLGGVGLAVTAQSSQPLEAARFAAWLAGADAQRDVVCRFGGQPASRSVWNDRANDALLGGYLSGTRTGLEAAWVRPRTEGWPEFQYSSGQLLAALLESGAPPNRIHRELGDLYRRHREQESAQ